MIRAISPTHTIINRYTDSVKPIAALFALLLSVNLTAQTKESFLEQNRFDLENPGFVFPQTDFNLIGFGAYHGGAKTYDAEFALIRSLKTQNAIDYYIPETNFSQAFFFQQYLDTGDEALLKELVSGFETIVIQEGTVETFNHWKRLRELNRTTPGTPVRVLGFDLVNEYRFPIRHLLYLAEDIRDWPARDSLQTLLTDKNADFSPHNETLQTQLKNFIAGYEANKTRYVNRLKDSTIFRHVLKNIAYTFADKAEREKILFDNYLSLKDRYDLDHKKQFAKYGYFHIQKARENKYPSFFTRLIEQKVYDRNKVITVMGYLTKSSVLWDKRYDKNGHYKGYSTKRGFGIGDYRKEYFAGIRNLKKTALSDLTLYRLNAANSPYTEGTDLVEIKMVPKKNGNGETLKGKHTLQFIDYAVLIRHSKSQVPIEEMERNPR